MTKEIREWNLSQIKRELKIVVRGADGFLQWNRGQELLIGLSNHRIRLRFPEGTQSPLQYLKNPPNELLHLTAVWICDLVPSGVLADCLEENYPEQAPVCQFLREFDQIKRENQR
jgi:hypothetical protein